MRAANQWGDVFGIGRYLVRTMGSTDLEINTSTRTASNKQKGKRDRRRWQQCVLWRQTRARVHTAEDDQRCGTVTTCCRGEGTAARPISGRKMYSDFIVGVARMAGGRDGWQPQQRERIRRPWTETGCHCTGANRAAKGQVNCCVRTGVGFTDEKSIRAGRRRHLVAPETGLRFVEDARIHRVTIAVKGKRATPSTIEIFEKKKKINKVFSKISVEAIEFPWEVL